MGKSRTLSIAITLAMVILVGAVLVFAWQSNMLLSGDYYVKVDNASLSQNEDRGEIVHLKSSEPYVYKLDTVNEAGDETTIEFGVSRELRQDAFLKLELQPMRGVVSWSEVSMDELPSKAAEALV